MRPPQSRSGGLDRCGRASNIYCHKRRALRSLGKPDDANYFNDVATALDARR